MRLWTLACIIGGLIVGAWLSQNFGVVFGLLGFGAFAVLCVLGLIAFSIRSGPRAAAILPTHPPTTRAGLSGCLKVVGAIVVFSLLGLFVYLTFFNSLARPVQPAPQAGARVAAAPSPIPSASPTLPAPVITATAQTVDGPVTTAKAAQPECVSVSDISLADVGQTVCVYGEVKSVGADELAQYVSFQSAKLRLITYDLSIQIPHQPGNCLKVNGLVRPMGGRPVLLFQASDLYPNC
jgi:hypothetical protein